MFQLGWFSENWLPHSNYPYLVKTIALYDPPRFLARLLFAGIICWLFLSTVFFVRAVFSSTLRRDVWLALFSADQIVMQFGLEQNHMVQTGFQLPTFLAIHTLPDA